jgi:hypothetical protein
LKADGFSWKNWQRTGSSLMGSFTLSHFENYGYIHIKIDCLFLEDWWVSGYALGLYPEGTCVSF